MMTDVVEHKVTTQFTCIHRDRGDSPVCIVEEFGDVGSCGKYCPHRGCDYAKEYYTKMGDDERREYFCDIHLEPCVLSDDGFGSCGDYNRYGACIWCNPKRKPTTRTILDFD